MAIGVVGYALPFDGDVMPFHLARAFKRTATMLVLANDYPNGEAQRSSLVSTSRSFWELDLALATTIGQDFIDELETHWKNHGGAKIPFTFYDTSETDPPYSYDITGIAATGKYTVRYDGLFQKTINIGQLRGSIPIRLVELAIGP